MDSKKRLRPVTLAVTLIAGCADHTLPPNAVPNADLRNPVPGWFDPNLKWNPNGGGSRIFIEGKVVFDVDRATIRPQSDRVLEDLLKFLQAHPEVTRVRIEGHTDSDASDEHNQELSAARSLAVCNWLVDRGIDHIRLVAVGFGEGKPIAPNELTQGKAENRRTEFHVMEVNGRPFGSKNALSGGMVLTVLSAEERERLRNPPKVAPPKGTAFIATGDEIKPYQAPPPKDFNAEEVIQASGGTPPDAGAIKKDGTGKDAPKGDATKKDGASPPAGGDAPK